LDPGGSKVFAACTERTQGPPSLLYDGYWVLFPGRKQLGHDIDHPPLSTAMAEYGQNYTSTSPLYLHGIL